MGKFDFLEELYVFNSKSNYVPREMYEKAQALADKRLELLRRGEWGAGIGRDVCPECLRHEPKGHTADCELAEAIDG